MEDIAVSYYQRTYKELKEEKILDFEDKYNIMASLNPLMKNALLNKPTLYNESDTCQILAIVNNVVVGVINCFDSQLLLNGKKIPTQAGSYLFVHEEFRYLAIGGDLMMQYRNLHSSKNCIAGGISQVAKPFYSILKYSIFEFPRFMFLRKSRSVIQAIFKIDGIILFCIAKAVDIGLWIYRKILFLFTSIRTMRVVVIQATKTPEEVENIVFSDPHPFMELHDKKWIDWNLNYTFKEDERNKKALYLIKKREDIIGFFITKMEFHKEASSRGFKNVYLGSVMEWGSKNEDILSETMIHLLALKTFPSCIDGVQMATSSSKTQKAFKRMGFAHIGDANMATFIKSVKEEGIKDINNWRIRLAVSDTLIN